jgi:hypothetical protein
MTELPVLDPLRTPFGDKEASQLIMGSPDAGGDCHGIPVVRFQGDQYGLFCDRRRGEQPIGFDAPGCCLTVGHSAISSSGQAFWSGLNPLLNIGAHSDPLVTPHVEPSRGELVADRQILDTMIAALAGGGVSCQTLKFSGYEFTKGGAD